MLSAPGEKICTQILTILYVCAHKFVHVKACHESTFTLFHIYVHMYMYHYSMHRRAWFGMTEHAKAYSTRFHATFRTN